MTKTIDEVWYEDSRFENLEDALRGLIQGKREDYAETAFLIPMDEQTALIWGENGWNVMTGYTSYSNVPVLAYELSKSNTLAMSVGEAIATIRDVDAYVKDVADRICNETGTDRNAGWELTYIDGVDRQAEDDRYMSVFLVFSEDGWGEGKKAIDNFVRQWERAGLTAGLTFDEDARSVEGEFNLHPKGGFFLKQRKLQMENKQRIAELREFLLSLTPYLRKF